MIPDETVSFKVEKDKNINLAQFELLEIEVKLKNESK